MLGGPGPDPGLKIPQEAWQPPSSDILGSHGLEGPGRLIIRIIKSPGQHLNELRPPLLPLSIPVKYVTSTASFTKIRRFIFGLKLKLIDWENKETSFESALFSS